MLPEACCKPNIGEVGLDPRRPFRVRPRHLFHYLRKQHAHARPAAPATSTMARVTPNDDQAGAHYATGAWPGGTGPATSPQTPCVPPSSPAPCDDLPAPFRWVDHLDVAETDEVHVVADVAHVTNRLVDSHPLHRHVLGYQGQAFLAEGLQEGDPAKLGSQAPRLIGKTPSGQELWDVHLDQEHVFSLSRPPKVKFLRAFPSTSHHIPPFQLPINPGGISRRLRWMRRWARETPEGRKRLFRLDRVRDIHRL